MKWPQAELRRVRQDIDIVAAAGHELFKTSLGVVSFTDSVLGGDCVGP